MRLGGAKVCRALVALLEALADLFRAAERDELGLQEVGCGVDAAQHAVVLDEERPRVEAAADQLLLLERRLFEANEPRVLLFHGRLHVHKRLWAAAGKAAELGHVLGRPRRLGLGPDHKAPLLLGRRCDAVVGPEQGGGTLS